eukprot:scaffold10959_cov60-Phaeocystis_antarctica.AAC.5
MKSGSRCPLALLYVNRGEFRARGSALTHTAAELGKTLSPKIPITNTNLAPKAQYWRCSTWSWTRVSER